MTTLLRCGAALALGSQLACADPWQAATCRKGGDAAISDYRQTLAIPSHDHTDVDDARYIEGLRRAIANECNDAARALAFTRAVQLSAMPPGTDTARRDALDAEILALSTESARVDDWWGGLGIVHMTRDSRYYDPQAAMKAFETGAAKGQRDSLDFVIQAYCGYYPDIAPDAAKAAFWREKQAALKR